MLRDVTIHAVLNGFEVKVGCQTVVFTDATEMFKEIKRYLKNPVEVENEYLEKALNAKKLFGYPATPSVPVAPPLYYGEPGWVTTTNAPPNITYTHSNTCGTGNV